LFCKISILASLAIMSGDKKSIYEMCTTASHVAETNAMMVIVSLITRMKKEIKNNIMTDYTDLLIFMMY